MSEKSNNLGKTGAVVVLGGGIAGMQSALDLADSGLKVYLVEKDSAIGGRMVQLDKTFPTNECAMCVVSPKLVDCARHPNIEIITNSELERIEGQAGNFTVTIKKKPRYIDEEKCTGCGACVLNCPVHNKIYLVPSEEKKVKLPLEVESEVTRIIENNSEKKGSLMLILQAVNRLYHYFSQDLLCYLSQKLNIPLSHILRIATFYSAFSLIPRGKHTISVCLGTSCYVKGSDRLLDELAYLLNVAVGSTTKDFKFTLKSVRCLGCCSIAPAMMIDEKIYGLVKSSDLSKILKDYK